ncbi:hypothetical protein ASE52_20855 [Acidovorax sp. Root275]|nr:hypothetical protein ASE52_20855 [Acidovorax sp. Root275]
MPQRVARQSLAVQIYLAAIQNMVWVLGHCIIWMGIQHMKMMMAILLHFAVLPWGQILEETLFIFMQVIKREQLRSLAR